MTVKRYQVTGVIVSESPHVIDRDRFEAVKASDYDALAAELAIAKEREQRAHSQAAQILTAKVTAEARVKELEAVVIAVACCPSSPSIWMHLVQKALTPAETEGKE